LTGATGVAGPAGAKGDKGDKGDVAAIPQDLTTSILRTNALAIGPYTFMVDNATKDLNIGKMDQTGYSKVTLGGRGNNSYVFANSLGRNAGWV
jgi:hypothetical protein